MIGKTLGHYQITSQLGKGGMGEVYQAKDQVLDRDVAIKVLPEEFAKDADRLARFQREAKLLASLNHPNIAAIHGLEESGGTNFLVLELVEGETLADQIKKGPIPVEESLKLALQIAEALEAAHEKGVIHRDLKPANIKVTSEGKVKVLDFGLAKAFAGEQAELNLSNSPTLSGAATQQGVLLGTAAYMSPEQARGHAVDKRADIWAFGCVLFEMLTGRPAFPGKDVTEILAAVIRAEPEWIDLPAGLHGRLREILERCLKKELKDRYHDISDVRIDIQAVLAQLSGVRLQPASAAQAAGTLRPALPWIAATFVLTAIAAGLAVWALKPGAPESAQVTRFSLEADGITTNSGIALSQDGSKLVYSASKDGVRQLFLRTRNQMTAVAVGDTKDAVCPFFSPDGNWVGFFTGSELKKVSLAGGVAQTLCKAGLRYGGTWGPDGTIVFASSDSQGLMRVSESGGEPECLTKSEAGIRHCWPEFLPNGKAVLFTIMKGLSNWQLAVLSLDTKKYQVLTEGTDGHLASSGHLVFARAGSLWAAPFNSKRLKLTGNAAPIVEGVQVNSGGWAHYALANDGSLAFLPGGLSSGPSATLAWMDRNGKEQLIAAASARSYFVPRISPDGTRAAFSIRDSSGTNIWIWDFARETLTRLTLGEGIDGYPLWTPDSKRIAYFSSQSTSLGVDWKAADGTGEVEQLIAADKGTLIPCSWSADGKTMILMEAQLGSGMDILALSMEGNRTKKPLLHEKYNETFPRISPDGRWMAYSSNESGQSEVYVRPFPDVDKGKIQISSGGGDLPIWSRDGRELLFRTKDSAMALEVKARAAFSPGKPQQLFKLPAFGTELSNEDYWDAGLDGRFLIKKPAQSASEAAAATTTPKINIVLNWLEELKQRVPVK